MHPRLPLLGCYDYGQGAVWLLLDAPSPEAAIAAYPKLTIFGDRPAWMSEAKELELRAELERTGFRWDVRSPPSHWLLSHAVEAGQVSLPHAIAEALAPLVAELGRHAMVPVHFTESTSFGNFHVTFATSDRALTAVRDRGQFMIVGLPEKELEESGLNRVFSGPRALTEGVRSWLRSAA
jgi:hypothetical protein